MVNSFTPRGEVINHTSIFNVNMYLCTCSYTRMTKRVNYIVQLKSRRFCEIMSFISDGSHHLAVVQPLIPAHHSTVPQCTALDIKTTVDSVVIPVQPQLVLEALPIEDIDRKCIFINATFKMYVVCLPNYIEKD